MDLHFAPDTTPEQRDAYRRADAMLTKLSEAARLHTPEEDADMATAYRDLVSDWSWIIVQGEQNVEDWMNGSDEDYARFEREVRAACEKYGVVVA